MLMIGDQGAGLGDIGLGEDRKHLRGDAGMGAAELEAPVSRRECLALHLDKCEECEDRGQLTGGDHRVAAIETAPKRLWARGSRRAKRAIVETAAACQPYVLFAVQQSGDKADLDAAIGELGCAAPSFFQCGRE